MSYLLLPSTIFKDVLPRSMEHGMGFIFNLTGNCGAALVTKYPTHRTDSPLKLEFETYTKHHYKSWVDFARFKKYGNDVQPVLVDGFDTTSDFAMVAYWNKDDTGSEAGNIPMFPSNPDSFLGQWHTRFLPRSNHGPQRLPHGPAPLQPDEYNHFVFVRYYTMCPRKRWELFSQGTVMRAGAGPDDLGPGDNRGDAFAELMVRYAEPTTSSDNDLGRQLDTTDGADSELYVVVRNTPNVWFPLCPPIFTLNLSLRMKNMTAGCMPSQITYSR